ncbi:MAG: signal peptide peptidase SppA [Saprospiraceae bacterium]|nr:signal peptide peptidase SppA [Saprospiraceae bacterium]
MAQFFKFLFASCLGFLVAIFAIFLIGGGIFARLAATADQSKPIKANSVLKIRLNNALPEQTNNLEISPYEINKDKILGIHDIVHCIETAKDDDKIKGIYLDLEFMTSGYATANVIRDALKDFKDSGKFIISYSKYYGQNAYYLATTADKVYVSPIGLVDFRGFAAQIPFYKNMLDNVGINMQVFYAGKFKSATEPFRRTDMSPENKLQVRAYLSSIYDNYLSEIAEGRNISEARLREIANAYEGASANSALSSDLVDAIGYEDQALTDIREYLGFDEGEKIPMVGLGNYLANNPKSIDFSIKSKVAVVYAEGTVVDGKGEMGTISDGKYVELIRDLRKDDNIKAIVLRINSPGGSAMASENIWRELSLAKADGKKIVVSMGDLAASGGYYIAAMADSIFARPNTLTGSIGVFTVIPSVEKLMNKNLGINYDTVKTGDFSTGIPVVFDMNEAEKQVMQNRTEEMYDIFLTRVSEGRGMTKKEVNEIAQGRVWTGEAALEVGLVDKIGDLEDAIKSAAKLADLDEYRITEYPKVKDPLERLIEDLLQEEEVHMRAILKSELGDWYPYYEEMQRIKDSKGAQAKLPFILPKS